MKKRIMYLAGIVAVVAIACSKGSSGMVASIDCSGGAKSFMTDVNPIIQSTCTVGSNCHAAGSNNGPGPLTSFQQVFNARTLIRSAVINGTMPKDGRLSATQINAIVCWIDNGAANN
ncbi:MAG TPA: hypothetical protein VFI06_03900 [Chitinophagaceae bacterium]|nr:hypothetical protein [Chitinophagaceae bacterium]